MDCGVWATMRLNINLPGEIAVIYLLSFETKLVIYFESGRCEVCTTIKEESAILGEELVENSQTEFHGKIKQKIHHFLGMLMIMIL